MKNYVRYAFGLALLVALMTIGLHYIPETAVQKAGLKPVNILADLNQGNSVDNLDQLDAETGAGKRPGSPQGGGYTVRSEVSPDTVASAAGDSSRSVSLIYVEQEGDTTAQADDKPQPIPAAADTLPEVRPAAGITPIVDYSAGSAMLRNFTGKLGNSRGLGRPVRVGFMGDSFIEGDLLTCDFRELMQNHYGGGGVGFVPITSQVAGFRQTVGHKFGKWKQNSIVNSKGSGFTISAFNYTPSEESYVEYKGSQNRKHLSRFQRARLLFISRGRSVVRATVNGEEEFLFNTDPSEALQEVLLEGDIHSIRYTVSDVEGFTAYGVFLENSSGVSVDNFSVRGNPGTVMGRISPTLSEQFGKLARYDLIVLQYGLNVVSSQVTDYTTYQKQMTTVVNHIKRCFPNTAILVMSVGDRATRSNGQFVTMPGIKAMVKTQQQVAQDCGVLFWSTYDVMRTAGGMETFVKNGWAAKDYTHISARGGKKIATALYDAVAAASR